MIDNRSTKRLKRRDRHDADRGELTLIRAGHHLWRQYRQCEWPAENGPLWEALEICWAAKRVLRRELAVGRENEAERARECFLNQIAQAPGWLSFHAIPEKRGFGGVLVGG